MLSFAVVFSSILALALFGISRIIIARGDFQGSAKWIVYGAAFLVLALLISSQWVYRARLEPPAKNLQYVFQYFGYLVMGLFAFSLFYFVVAETIERIASKFNPERRLFMNRQVVYGLLGASVVSTLAGWLQAEQGPKIRRVKVPIANLPEDIEGLTIAQATDIHIGPLLQKDFMERVVDQLMSLNADVIAITGDMVDGTVEQLKDHVAPLSRLKAKYGVYFVNGNHEYYWGAEEWAQKVRSLGLQVLENSNRVFTTVHSKVMIAGVNDYKADSVLPNHASDPKTAIESPEACQLKVLLAHQPRSIYAACDAGFDLQISGHTHAGQFYPWKWLVHLAQPYVQGLHPHVNEKGDKTWIYVNAGTGYWGPPVRLGVPAEITLLKITRAPDPAQGARMNG